jgi:hypothetical protein
MREGINGESLIRESAKYAEVCEAAAMIPQVRLDEN